MRLGDRIAMMRDGRIVQVGTAEEILTDPANDYVAQFVADVDRTRVLTAGSVMEKPVAVLGTEQGPRAAHRLIRENQLSALFVVDRQNNLRGVVYEDDVSRAVQEGRDDITALIDPSPMSVSADTVVADLFSEAAESRAPLPVVGESGRLLGVIPRVTLLNALAPTTETEVSR
jgi:glycine betaine/proline transport system ATP-binding protein